MEKDVDFSLLLQGLAKNEKVGKNFCQTELFTDGIH